ncbi:hypothetical protein V5F77_06840 [Xanthobacter sp. DSM 24535]|uniref:hypothetical protein n=1 Tax=Roseixanthobacter psychrophilus TaxID=3119917 RepID=UPI0037286CA0
MANWKLKLSRPITLSRSAGGRTLVTLRDAAGVLHPRFDKLRCPTKTLAIELLGEAAENEGREAIRDATDQLARFLAEQRVTPA